jgi:hypothetical protein
MTVYLEPGVARDAGVQWALWSASGPRRAFSSPCTRVEGQQCDDRARVAR